MIKATVLSISVMIGCFMTPKSSSYRGRSHRAVVASFVSAAYSASQVLCAVTVCFFDHQAIGDPPIRNKIPEVRFDEKILPQLLSDEALS